MRRIDAERTKPVGTPPLAPLIAAASIPLIQLCILFTSVYGRARCKRLRFFLSNVAYTDAALTPATTINEKFQQAADCFRHRSSRCRAVRCHPAFSELQ